MAPKGRPARPGAAKGKNKAAKQKTPEGEDESDLPEHWEKLLNGTLDLCRVLGAGAAGGRGARGGRGGRGGRPAPRGVGRRGRQQEDDDDEDDGEGDEDEDDDDPAALAELIDECQNAASDALAEFAAESRHKFVAALGGLLEEGITSREAQNPRKAKLVHKAVLGVLQALIGLAGSALTDAAADPRETTAFFTLIETTNNSMAELDRRCFDANVAEYIALVSRAAVGSAQPIKVREHAVLSLCAVIQGHVDTILKHKQLDAVIDIGFALTRDAQDQSMSSSTTNATNLGTTLLDTLTAIVGQVPQAASIVAQNILDRCLKGSVNADPFVRKGALISLAVLPENAEEFLTAQDLPSLFTLMTVQLDAKEEVVRAAARMAFAEFATHLPSFTGGKNRDTLVAKMSATVSDAKEVDVVKAKSVLLLLNLVESWPRADLATAAKPIVESMLKLIADTYAAAKPPAGDAECVRYPCALIRAVIRTLSPDKLDNLKPLVPALTTALTGVLALPDAKTMETLKAEQPDDDNIAHAARAEAVQCLGNVARLMTASDVAAAADKWLPLVFGCYEFPCHRVREAANEAVAEIATATGDAFVGSLEKWFVFVERALDPSYHIKNVDGEHTQSQLAVSDMTSMVAALKEVCTATKAGFKPHVAPLFEKLVNVVQFAPKEVAELLGALPAAMPLDKPWVKGVVSPLSEEIKEVFEQAQELLLDIIEKTEDEEVAAACLDAIGRIADAYGAAIVPDEFLERVVEITTQVMQSEAETAGEHEHGSDCDHDEDDDEDGEGEDDDEEDDAPKAKGKHSHGHSHGNANKKKATDAKADTKDDAESIANIFGKMAVDPKASSNFEFNFNFGSSLSADAGAAGGAAPAEAMTFQFVPPSETSAAAAPEPAAAAAATPAQVPAAAAADAKSAPAAAAADAKDAKGKEKEADAEDDDDSDDEDDEPSGLISAIDLIGDLARVKGPAWFASFRAFYPFLLDWAQNHKQKRVRVHCFGTLADVADSLDDRFNDYVDDCFGAALAAVSPLPKLDASNKALKVDDLSLLRNVSFFVGVMALKGDAEKVVPFVPKAVNALLPVLAMALQPADPLYEDKAALRDNATSAVAKLLLTHPKSCNIELVLPAFLAALPLEVDMDENNFVYSSVIKMIHTFPKQFPGVLEKSYAQILAVFHAVLTSHAKPLKDTLKVFMAKTCAGLLVGANADSAKLNAILAQWPADKRSAFQAAIAAAAVAGPHAADAKADDGKSKQ